MSEIGVSGAVRPSTALPPILEGVRVEGEVTSKLGAAEAGCGACGADVNIRHQWDVVNGGGGRFYLRNFSRPT